MLKQPLDGWRFAGDRCECRLGPGPFALAETLRNGAYAASKGAVRAMTLAAAARYAPDRIRFNLLVPGLIDTPMAARAMNDARLRPYLAQAAHCGRTGKRSRRGRSGPLSVRAGLAVRHGGRAGRRWRLVRFGREVDDG